jgi:hypothetical protein
MVEVNTGTWARLIRFALLLIFVPGSVLAFIALAITINGQPPLSPFHGWVAVMQPGGQLSGDQVQLLVQTFGSGSHPLVSYTVGICGQRPYSGDLLIGQDAELFDTVGVTSPPGSSTVASIPQAPVRHIAKFGLAGITLSGVFYQTSNIGPVEVAQILVSSPLPCGLVTGAVSDEQAYVAGYLSVPLQQISEGPLALWHGPNVSQAWPMTGAPPDVFPGVGYKFQRSYSESLPPGYWVLPAQEQVEVVRFDAPASWSVDTTQPAATSASPLSWSSDSAIQPMARLTDSSLATLQDWLGVAGVGLGVGWSLLVGLAFAASGRRRATAAAYATRGPGPPSETPALSPGRAVRPPPAGRVAGMAVVAAAIVIGLVRHLYARRRT